MAHFQWLYIYILLYCIYIYIHIWVCLKMKLPGREVCLRGLFRGSVSWYVSGVCFGGLFRTVLLPRTFKFKGPVSGSVSKVCFGGLFRQSRTSQPYLKLHSPKKCKPIYSTWPWILEDKLKNCPTKVATQRPVDPRFVRRFCRFQEVACAVAVIFQWQTSRQGWWRRKNIKEHHLGCLKEKTLHNWGAYW